MTGTQIVNAYRAMKELSDTVLPYKASRGITRLKKRLDEEFATIIAMELALAKQHSGKKCGQGRYEFPTTEDTQAFTEELSVAMEQEDDIKLPKVDLSAYSNLVRVSAGAIEALDGLVIFDDNAEEDQNGG